MAVSICRSTSSLRSSRSTMPMPPVSISSKNRGFVLVADLDERPDAVAGDARHVIDDGDPPARQPVQERRLADVGSAHDHDLGESHECHHAGEINGKRTRSQAGQDPRNDERGKAACKPDGLETSHQNERQWTMRANRPP